ncbi:DUF397 domain-containing protein [Streptomyces litchfieldiae]|uniref:DUF397 domain-containing protein n=1 Tax=Streptomyces litchfieldiae TaxID=3075543 RepID=A0ABU2ML75_9ACTN|nr:DUF397 domain-containing protein [Streptomyces sp. DSM 44938]MDT0342240.1 DUF397 domain-containing protein [Streptomyces sp. DSM 44938]
MKSTIDLSGAEWVKSSHSSGNGGACVEYARNIAVTSGVVPVRDSKDLTGPVLAFSTGGWTGFVSALRDGDLVAH